MLILSSIHSEGLLVRLVSDSVSDFWAKHHLVTAHEVGHNVLKLRLKRLRVDQVEVDLIVASDLDPLISLDEKDEASGLDLVVLPPFFDNISVLVLFCFDLEEYHFAWTSGDQGFIVEKVHLTEVHFCHPFVNNICGVVSVDVEGLALPVKRVYHIIIRVVEALVWKVLRGALHFCLVNLSFDRSSPVIVYKVVVDQLVVVEQLNEHSVVSNEGAGAERVTKSLDRHGVVVDPDCVIDIKFFIFNGLVVSGHFSEES